MLADGAPGNKHIRHTFRFQISGRGGNAIEADAFHGTELLCIPLQSLTAQLTGNGSKGAVAAAGKGSLQIHNAVDLGTGNLVYAVFHKACTFKLLLLDIRDRLQRRSKSQHLKDRARCIGRLQEAVYIQTVEASGLPFRKIRHIVRVKGGCGYGA